MTTGRDIVTGALQNLNVLGIGEDLDAAEAELALGTLNDMGAAWEAMGVFTGWSPITLSNDFPLEARHVEGVKWMLAGRLAPVYGKALSPDARALVDSGWSTLQADYRKIEPLGVDLALRNMPSQRIWGGTV